MAEAAVSLTERIIKDPDFNLLLENAQKFLAEQPKPTLEDRILADPDFDLLLENANKYLKPTKKPKRAKTKLALATGAALLAASSISGAAGPAVLPVVKALGESLTGQTSSQQASEEQSTPTVTASPTPKPTETPKPTSTPEIKILKKDLFREMVGPRIYKEIEKARQERAKIDPEFWDRINPELNQDRINVLILGGRKEDTLTDTILVLSYHLPTHTLHQISIPRDLQSPEVFSKNRSASQSRINQAFGEGGFELTTEALENATGLSMDLPSYVNFDVLVNLIDQTVGYVEVELDKPINDRTYPALEGSGYDPFFISAGKHQLDGATALKVARSRHGSSDYDRSERQQKIIKAYINRVLEESKNPKKAVEMLINIRDILDQKVNEGTLKPDFDLQSLLISNLIQLIQSTPQLLWNQAFGGGWSITESPTIYSSGITNRNFVVGAGVEGTSITKVSGGNPYSRNPRGDYWNKTRQYVETFLTQNLGEPPPEEEIRLVLPAKETRILYPKELSYQEVKPWIGKLRDSHEAVLTESLFTKELASMPEGQRKKVLETIAQAHATALIEHFGDVEAIIGLDPGHGGSDIGSSGVTSEGPILREKDLTWQLSQMIAEEIYKQSAGKYYVVFLRPENPVELDLDNDGVISPIERLQKRKALLLQMEQILRPNLKDRGKNILYLSIHLNGSPDPNQKGLEVFWPNEVSVANPTYREASQVLAQLLHQRILSAIRESGYDVLDRGAKEDPDKRVPLSNAEITTGPYIALGSPKLDRVLQR